VQGVGIPIDDARGFVFLHVGARPSDWRAFGTGRLAIHEVGHALGLDHNFGDGTSVMDYNQTQWRFGPGDLAGLRDQIVCGSR
jgi:hypothetical protein